MQIRDKLNIIHRDNMEYMATVPDNYFDLAVVDPEYGIGINNQSQGKGGGVAKKNNYKRKSWDNSIPPAEYFKQIKRVSKNQIIWGGNYFIQYLDNTPCFIVWDKLNGETDFADCELAWTSFQTSVRKFTFKWSGMLQGDMKNKEHRIHPTQKPVKLYEWIYDRYATENCKVIDTHLGSGSNAIAAHYSPKVSEFVGIEIDDDYYQDSVKRIIRDTEQLKLF